MFYIVVVSSSRSVEEKKLSIQRNLASMKALFKTLRQR